MQGASVHMQAWEFSVALKEKWGRTQARPREVQRWTSSRLRGMLSCTLMNTECSLRLVKLLREAAQKHHIDIFVYK